MIQVQEFRPLRKTVRNAERVQAWCAAKSLWANSPGQIMATKGEVRRVSDEI
jgi:hypothetical protein